MPYRTMLIVLIALIAVVMPLDAAEFVPPDGPSVAADADLCGTCADYDEETCNLLEMNFECHVWEYDTNGADKRGEDAHAVAGDFEVGNGTCNVEHEGPCFGSTDEVP